MTEEQKNLEMALEGKEISDYILDVKRNSEDIEGLISDFRGLEKRVEDLENDEHLGFHLTINDINARLTLAGIKNDEGGQLIADLIDAVDGISIEVGRFRMNDRYQEEMVVISHENYLKIMDALSAVKTGKVKPDKDEPKSIKNTPLIDLVADLVKAAEEVSDNAQGSVSEKYMAVYTPVFMALRDALSALKGES